MKIEILEQSASDIQEAVWLISRPALKHSEIKGELIKKLDLPVNEFPSMVLEITSTILEREIITSMRNHVMWAQTSRVNNVLEFETPEEFSEHYVAYEDLRTGMEMAKDKGARQDDYRLLMPVMSLTTYCIRISVRDLAKISNYFYKVSQEIPHLTERFLDVSTKMDSALWELGYGSSILNGYKACAPLRNLTNMETGIVGDTVVVSSVVPLALRAHMIRHRQLHVSDNLIRLMKLESIITESLSMELRIQVSGHKDDFASIVGKRSCWIAQYNLWKDFLNKAETLCGITETDLPCANGKCPFNADAEARYTDADPNAPCPIHARLNSNTVSAIQIEEMNTQWNKDERPSFWVGEIGRVEVGEAN